MLRVVDHVVPAGNHRTLEKLPMPPTSELTAELDGAATWLGLTADEILLAALGRTIARTIGEGVVGVDVIGERRWLLQAVPLTCATGSQMDPTELLRSAHSALATATRHTAAQSEVLLNFVGPVPDEALPMYDAAPGLEHALELRAYRAGGLQHLDWWYDVEQFDRYTVEELAEQFPLALVEMTSDASPLL